MPKWVCPKCGLVAEAGESVTCAHPGFPYGPGYSPPKGARGYMTHFREVMYMQPYTGPVDPGFTDPAFHILMGAK